MFWLNCMFFRGWRYYYPVPMSRLTVLGISLVRGIVGGLLLYAILNFINPFIGGGGMRWEMVTGSPWFYVVMFLIGFCWVQIFFWGFLTLLVMNWLGWLVPLIEAIKWAFILFAMAFFYVLNLVTGGSYLNSTSATSRVDDYE